jgi:hypothetical protein
MADFKLESSAFIDGASIPRQHTCDGQDLSPALAWTGEPSGTRAFALICDDPDAPRGTWVHWVLYDLPAAAHAVAPGLSTDAELKEPAGARQGKNDFGRTGYGGPCPPPGPAHRYFFKVYALDREIGLPGGKTKAEVEAAMKGHVLAEAQLMGMYRRA